MAQLRRSSEKRAALVEPPQRSQKSCLFSSDLFRLGGPKACALILGVPVADTTSTGPHVRAALLLAVSALPQCLLLMPAQLAELMASTSCALFILLRPPMSSCLA